MNDLATNSTVFLCPKSCGPDFKARNTGHIINLGSIAGREPYAGGGIYCATKHAVRSFTGTLLRELVNTGIRVTEVQPGTRQARVLNPTGSLILTLRQEWSRLNSPSCASAGTSPLRTRFTRVSSPVSLRHHYVRAVANLAPVVAEDIAEEIVWAA